MIANWVESNLIRAWCGIDCVAVSDPWLSCDSVTSHPSGMVSLASSLSPLATGNDTAAETFVAGIEHGRLARRHGPLRRRKANPAAVAIVLDQRAALQRLPMAEPAQTVERGRRRRTGADPVQLLAAHGLSIK